MSIPHDIFPGKLGIQQRVLPAYRVPFFNQLAQACQGGLSLFAGEPRPEEHIQTAQSLESAQFYPARNIHLLRGAFYACWQHDLVKWLTSWQPDALILEANPRWLSTPAAIRWMRSRGRPVLGWGLGLPANGIRINFWRRFLRQFDGLIAYSRRGAKQYQALGVLPAERIFVAPNAVMPAPRWGLPTRSIRPKRLTVLFVGRLQPRKRVDLLIKACARLPQSIQPKLLIVGDGPARASLERLAQEIYPDTVFLGAVHGKSLHPIWMQADLFVLPGTGGLAVQEAMSYGLPVIVARGDGTQDDLVHPSTGWVIPPDDLLALENALLQALSDLPSLRTMGASAYRHVSQHANLERMVAAFVQALNQTVALRQS